MKNYDYWKKLHESEKPEEFSTDNIGFLWLKTKSIVRKELIGEFIDANKIKLSETSSKMCSICGFIKSDLTLKDRSWTCPSCSTEHDRDINAAINIKKFGYIRSQGTEIETKQGLSEPSMLEVGAMKRGSPPLKGRVVHPV